MSKKHKKLCKLRENLVTYAGIVSIIVFIVGTVKCLQGVHADLGQGKDLFVEGLVWIYFSFIIMMVAVTITDWWIDKKNNLFHT